jgi:prolyl-tRNA synthetase
MLTEMILMRRSLEELTNMPKDDEEQTPLRYKKAEDFNEWYNEVVERAELCDKRYPVKGLNIWTAHGWKAMQAIDAIIRKEMADTAHGEVCFPLLVPEDQFKKEADHIKGFSDEVYWVTRAGGNELDVKLLLRPTSETAMYPIFSLWVRSHADLPLKIFQIVNAFRFDTKQTRAFIRMREFHFFEAHTCHESFEDAEKQIQEDLHIMERLAHELCLSYLLLKRPEWDKFPGAFYSLAADALMPDGRTLQIGTIHQYKDNFAKAYDVKYEAEGGEHKLVHQTTYGMSERLLGAVVGMHGDDNGVLLPPAIAPVQVVVVPILAKENKEPVIAESEAIARELAKAGIRARLDCRDIRPGAKYYHWEMRGVPLRLEIGPRDMKEGKVVLVRRDNRQKAFVPRVAMVPEVRRILDLMALDLRARSADILKKGIRDIGSLEEEAAGGILRAGWCGQDSCGHEMEDRLGVKVLGTLYEGPPYAGKCAVCGNDASLQAYLARTY